MLMQKQKNLYIRQKHERIGAMALALVTLTGMATVTRVNRSFYKEVTTNPDFAFSQITERGNETARIPVRFDVGIHSPTTGGI